MKDSRRKRIVSSVRTGLVGLVMIAFVPAFVLLFVGHAGRPDAASFPWRALLLLGALAASLLAAWGWSQAAILGPLDAMLAAAKRMRSGDLSARVGLADAEGDLGQIGEAFDALAAGLETREVESAQTAAALRESHERLQAILTASPLAIVTVDGQGRVMLWTPAAERIFGWRSDEVMGRPVPWVPESKQEEATENLRRLNRGERLHGVQVRRLRKDGQLIDLRAWTSALRRSDGTLYGTIVLIEDMTERKALEDQLQRSQKMQAIGRLAGGLAHDFNNLLTVIRGHAELGLRKLESRGPVNAHLMEVRNAALRANALIRQLLTFHRQPAGAPRVMEVNRSIEQMVTLLQPLLGEQTRLVLDLGEEAGSVRVDDGQLVQVITNLAVNARDAMPNGGEIRIRTRRADLSTVIGAQDAGEGCEITVSDDGSGMDAETLQHVFEPFFSTKDPSESAGLGLSTVYAIVRQAGGDVRVESEPGRGSTFHVYLPRGGFEAVRSTAPARPVAGSGTLLLVEDEADVRAVLRQTLESAGYTVLEAEGGAQALDVSARHEGPIDLLLADVVLPGFGGPELAERLIVNRPGLRALFISGYAPTPFEEVRAIPGTAFLAKPFDLATLTARVHELLQGRGRARAA